jgi:hypothetical protein
LIHITSDDLRPPRSVPIGAGRCCACSHWCDDDIYDCGGWVLCGDCRYTLRHDREPIHEQHPGYNAGGPPTRPEDTQVQETPWVLGRHQKTATLTPQQYEILWELEGFGL